MKFVEAERCGTVLGNEVKARPIPFSRMMEVEKAQRKGDGVEVLSLMSGIVGDFVTMADGERIDEESLSAGAVAELFKFASNLGGGVADFT